MKEMAIIGLVVVVGALCVNSAYGFHDSFSLDHPCSVKINSFLFPIVYNGTQRQNPDGSFYPSDGFHYLFVFSGSDTCINFRVNSMESEGGIGCVVSQDCV
ncbi:MAG: hypothetical protein J4F36_13455 [Nitrosopumilaceae archaeon]|nr:hypothetical protein [Nitrosopumilaceae archaeon]